MQEIMHFDFSKVGDMMQYKIEFDNDCKEALTRNYRYNPYMNVCLIPYICADVQGMNWDGKMAIANENGPCRFKYRMVF